MVSLRLESRLLFTFFMQHVFIVLRLQKRRHVDVDVQELGKNGKRRKAAERNDEPEMFGEKHWICILYHVYKCFCYCHNGARGVPFPDSL